MALKLILGRGILGNRTRGGERSTVLRRFLTVLFLFGVSLVAITAAQAGSPPVTFTDTFTETDTFTDIVPCQENLGPYDITTNARGVFHVTAAGIDEEENFIPPYHVTGTVTGTFVAVPSDGTGPTFTGRFTDRFGETEMITHSTGTTTFFVQGRSSDGSRVSFHLVTHYTITGTGVEFGFEKPSC
jgi:hypothetical protein